MNIDDPCRTCLGKDKDMRQLNSTIMFSGQEVCIAEILDQFYNYKVPQDDNLTQSLCINCVHQLTLTYSFKNLIEKSFITLSERAQTIESPDEPIDDTFDYDSSPYEPCKEDTIPHKRKAVSKKVKRKLLSKNHTTKKKIHKILYCVECRKSFNKVGDLRNHFIRCHERKSTKGRECEYCSEKLENLRALILHHKKHQHQHVCERCFKGFQDSEELETHNCKPKLTKQEKSLQERVLKQCHQCGKSYPSGYIKIHMQTHGEDRPYKCKFCPKTFKVPACLNSHVLWNHKRTRDHRCETCNATFISSSSKSSHIRKYHLKEKKYLCKCGKRFFSKSELDRHNLTHTGVKNFHCHHCDKSYQTRYGLNVHLKSHSQINLLAL